MRRLRALLDRFRTKNANPASDTASDQRSTNEIAGRGGLGRPPMLPEDDRPKHQNIKPLRPASLC